MLLQGGNARYVRNVLEQAMMHHSLRIVEMDVRSREVFRRHSDPFLPLRPPFRTHAAATRRDVCAQDLETLRGADFDEIDV